jgi:hypothetical protein
MQNELSHAAANGPAALHELHPDNPSRALLAYHRDVDRIDALALSASGC